MEKSITINMNEERYKALRKYLRKKANSTIEQELESSLEKLFEKYVPVSVREYLEEDDEGSESEAGGRE